MRSYRFLALFSLLGLLLVTSGCTSGKAGPGTLTPAQGQPAPAQSTQGQPPQGQPTQTQPVEQPASLPQVWQWRHPLPTGNPLGDVAYGNGLFVVPDDDAVLTSPDGKVWTRRVTGADPVGLIAFGNGRFVTIGDHGTTITSTDGLTWQQTKMGADRFFQKLSFGDGRFMARDPDDPSHVLVSTDGLTWRSVPAPSGLADPFSTAQGNGRTVRVTYEKLLTSADGTHWTESAAPAGGGYSGVVYGNGGFVAWGAKSRGVNMFQYSADGLNWQTVVQRVGEFTVRAAGGLFVGLGDGGTILTSADGKVWTERSQRLTDDPKAAIVNVAYGNGRFVAMVYPGHLALTSADGVTWSAHPYAATKGAPTSIAFGGGLFVAVTVEGEVLTSPDGERWQVQPATQQRDLTSVAYGAGRFVAVGATIISSADGRQWTASADAKLGGSGVAYGNGQFVVVDGDGFLTSTDGTNWTKKPAFTKEDLEGIAYGNGRYVTVSNGGAAFTSLDGEHWTGVSQTVGSRLFLAGGWFVATTVEGEVLFSQDGTNWTTQKPTWNWLCGVAYGNGRFVVVGADGSILTSEPN